MSTNDGTTSKTQTSERPTRTGVVLTLAMMAVPLLTLLVSAAGCSRSTARTTASEVRDQNESPPAHLDTTPH